MLKHIEDGADLNILISDEGGLLLVCSGCKKVWTGTLQVTAVSGQMAGEESANAAKLFNSVKKHDPSILDETGLSMESLEALLPK